MFRSAKVFSIRNFLCFSAVQQTAGDIPDTQNADIPILGVLTFQVKNNILMEEKYEFGFSPFRGISFDSENGSWSESGPSLQLVSCP